MVNRGGGFKRESYQRRGLYKNDFCLKGSYATGLKPRVYVIGLALGINTSSNQRSEDYMPRRLSTFLTFCERKEHS